MLSDQERNELDVAALQRHLMDLTKQGADVAALMVEAVAEKGEADKNLAVLKAKSDWIKQEISATQTSLRSIV